METRNNNTQPLSPQGYNINEAPINTNPFYNQNSGGNVPAGGATGQVLAKASVTDYDTEWVDPGATREYVNAQDATLQGNINAEAEARAAADTALGNRVTAVETGLTTEAGARAAADTALGGRVDTETAARAAADTALGNRATALETGLQTEQTTRANADTALGNRVTAVETEVAELDITSINQRVTAVETGLTEAEADITTVAGSVTTEAGTRAAADTALGQRIDGEQTARAAAVQSLTTGLANANAAISTETDNREAADTALDGRVDVLETAKVPTGGTAGQVLYKETGADYDTAWGAVPPAENGVPAGGATGKVLAKASATDYDTEWVDNGGGTPLPTPTTAGTVLTADSNLDPAWAAVPPAENGLPTGGTAGQVLTKNSATDFDASWANGGGSSGLYALEAKPALSLNWTAAELIAGTQKQQTVSPTGVFGSSGVTSKAGLICCLANLDIYTPTNANTYKIAVMLPVRWALYENPGQVKAPFSFITQAGEAFDGEISPSSNTQIGVWIKARNGETTSTIRIAASSTFTFLYTGVAHTTE